MNNVKLYCISGLGVDERAFINIKPAGIDLIFIDWIDPLPGETLEHYAARMYENTEPEDGYNLLGLSFGGMIAQEFARIKKPGQLILLSTISSGTELRWIFRLLGYIGILKIIPGSFFEKPNALVNYLFSAKNSQQKGIVRKFIAEADPGYIKWAIGAILKWTHQEKPSAIRIHGSNDRLVPYQTYTDFLIRGGSHFMVLDRGKEISAILENVFHTNE